MRPTIFVAILSFSLPLFHYLSVALFVSMRVRHSEPRGTRTGRIFKDNVLIPIHASWTSMRGRDLIVEINDDNFSFVIREIIFSFEFLI